MGPIWNLCARQALPHAGPYHISMHIGGLHLTHLQLIEALKRVPDLYLADEVFMVGTATEVAPLRAVDDHEIGVGPITRALQTAYLDTVHGRSERWAHWLDAVEMSPSAA